MEVIDKKTFESRVLRDIHSSVIVLDNKGMIRYINKPAARKFEIDENVEPGKVHFEANVENSYNDDFNQYIFDSIYQKKSTHSGTVKYMSKSGIQFVFRISASYFEEEDFVIITLEDITIENALEERVHDSSLVFTAFLFMLSIWIIICELVDYIGNTIPNHIMTIGVEIMGVLLFIFILKFTSLSFKDIGLFTSNTKKVVRDGILISISCIIILVLIKFITRQFNPNAFKPNMPFFNLDTVKRIGITYFFTAGVQEFLARGVVQSNLERMIVGDHKKGIAIVLSGLLFATLHLYYGFFFMMGAAVLAMIEGVLYSKQKSLISIWIVHYIFGLAGMTLSLV